MGRTQERAGYCARCELQVMVRKQQGAWESWRCTVCGTKTPPLPEATDGRRLGFWLAVACISIVIVLMLANIH